MIRAYELLKDEFSRAEKTTVKKWLTKVVEYEMSSRKNGKETSFNNWNSHRLNFIGLIAFTLNNKQYIDYTIRGFKEQVAADLLPDGESYDFQVRDA
jgi:hypothetical protein